MIGIDAGDTEGNDKFLGIITAGIMIIIAFILNIFLFASDYSGLLQYSLMVGEILGIEVPKQ